MVDLSELAAGFGRGILALGTGGISELARSKREQSRRAQMEQLANLARVASGENIPAFRREELQSQGMPIEREILANLQAESLTNPLTSKAALQEAMKRAFPSPREPLVNISTGTQETAREKALGLGRGQARVKFEDDIDSAATSGVNLLNTLPILRQSLDASGEGGAAKSAEVMVKGLFNQFGADVDEEKLANEQTFNAEVKRLITPTIKALGSNPSNADRQFITDSFAGLDKSKKTNDKLLTIQEAVAIKALEKQKIKDANLDLPDSGVKKMLREYDSENSLSDLVKKIESQRKQAQTLPTGQIKFMGFE